MRADIDATSFREARPPETAFPMSLLDAPPVPFRSDRQQTFLAHQILMLADRLGMSIAVAESCTGGRLASILTGVEGFSHCFECAFVPHSDRSKSQLLGVPEALIELDGAVSAPVAKLMAKGALSRSEAAIAIAITGLSDQANEPGILHVATYDRNGLQRHEEHRFAASDRPSFQDLAVEVALKLLHDHLLSISVENAANGDESMMFPRIASPI